MLNGASCDVARDAQALRKGPVTHLADLGNGFVVGFGFADSGAGEPDKCGDDNRDQDGKFPVFSHTIL